MIAPHLARRGGPCGGKRVGGVLAVAMSLAVAASLRATILDQIGVTQLLQVNPALTGAGVTVAQVEASAGYGDLFEPNPADQNTSSNAPGYTFINDTGTVSSTFDPAEYSSHADMVASDFYGAAGGVSPGIAHVDVWDASEEYTVLANGGKLIPAGQTVAPAVVNQSFIFEDESAGEDAYLTMLYDSYAATNNTLFVSGVGNGANMTTATTPASQINPPSDAYNGVAVAAYGGSSGVGPTWDGRSKPDITAPGGETSFTTPLVSGVATLLVQAGNEGAGGSGTQTAATNIRTLKALLLNGAVKPAGWYHTATSPLDPRYGAGIVNAYNSYVQLAAGMHPYSAATSTALGATPTFDSTAPLQTSPTGWNLASITSGASANGVDHYMFNLPAKGNNVYDLTATLVWNRQAGQSKINNLDLYLVNSANDAIAVSDSSIDNVQQLFIGDLIPGQYDLVVMKLGGANEISPTSTYSLAYQFTDPVGTPEPATLTLLLPVLALLPRRAPRKRHGK